MDPAHGSQLHAPGIDFPPVGTISVGCDRSGLKQAGGGLDQGRESAFALDTSGCRFLSCWPAAPFRPEGVAAGVALRGRLADA